MTCKVNFPLSKTYFFKVYTEILRYLSRNTIPISWRENILIFLKPESDGSVFLDL